MDLLVTWAMKPTMEKMTNPANMLVHELMQQTMMESLQRGEGTVRGGAGSEVGNWLAKGLARRVLGSEAIRQGVPPPTPREGTEPEEVAKGIGSEKDGVDSGEGPAAWLRRKGLLGASTCRHCCGKNCSSQERSRILGPAHRRRKSE